MSKYNRRILGLFIVLSIIFLFQISLNLIILSGNIIETEEHFSLSIQDYNEIYLDNDLYLKRLSESPASRAISVDLIINKDQLREFTKDRGVNNVTIRDEATMIIKDCEFWINGSLKVMDNARLFIMNSTVHIEPGPVDQQEIIINFSDNARVQISDSNLYTCPQPSVTNISYLLSDDNSEISIIRSYLNLKLPAILYQDIELTPPTAGTFILTGETNWNIHNCTIECYLYFDENDMLAGRWFLFTLQRRSGLYIKDTVGSMENDETQPFIKPVAGFVKLENCIVRKGVIDNEVIGELEAINLTIFNLNLRDQTTTRIFRSNIENNIDVGSLAIFSPADIGTKPKATLYMEDSIVGTTLTSGGMLLAAGNSTTTLKKCSLKKCSVHSSAKIQFVNCSIEQLIDGKDSSQITLENTTVLNIFLNDYSELNINSKSVTLPINTITTQYNCHAKISLHEVTIKTLEVWPGDNIPPEEYGSGYEPDSNISKLTIKMVNSDLDKLLSSDDAEIFLTLQDSTVNEFAFKKFKKEHILISILDLGSIYYIPETWPDIDLKIMIYHELSIITQANGNPIKSSICVTNNKEEVLSSYTSEAGEKDLELFYEEYTSNRVSLAGEYSIKVTYLGFSELLNTNAEIGDNYLINWEDHTPPIIGNENISINKDYQRTERGTLIRVYVADSEVKLVANATIYYQTRKNNGWLPEKNVPMIEVGSNKFEGVLPQVEPGTEVRFYIVAYDILGNNNKPNDLNEPDDLDMHSYKIEDTRLINIAITLVLIISIFFLILVYIFSRRRKLKDYLNKPRTTVSGEIDAKK